MSSALLFPPDFLSSEQRAALVALAQRLWQARDAIAKQWSADLAAAMPNLFRADDASAQQIEAANLGVISVVLDHLRRGDLDGLSQVFHAMNRQLIQVDLEGPHQARLSLDTLYASGRHALHAMEAYVGNLSALEVIAFGKLGAHLLMLVALAYNESREAALEHARQALEGIVQERTAALAKEKALADTIIESLPGVFYLFDENGCFLNWNHNFETVAQYSAEELASMHATDFFAGAEKNYIAERMAEVFRLGQSTAEANFTARDGTQRPYFFTGRRAWLDERPCLLGMGIDVSERRQAEEALRRARTAQIFGSLLESAPDAMVVSDANGRIVFANSQTERMFGYLSEDLFERTVDMLIADELRGPARGDDGRTDADSIEAAGLHRDGSRFPVEIKVSPLETEDGPLLTRAIRDITDRRRAEAEIRHLYANLERRVEQRTRELARSNADLEQFAYVASHDLQEPLRAVKSYSQLLARRYEPQLAEEGQRYIERTVAAVSRMQALIADLLAYSRIGRQDAPPGRVECESVLRDVLEDLQAGIAEAGATVTHDVLPAIPGDRSQLRQLLQNLIGNAIKFRGATAPCVHLSAKRNGGTWIFAVKDNGIGIASEYAERIFAIFQRLHGRGKYPGTGVGLAICKKIVERHGGRIWVESAPDEGTRMCFELPAEHAEQ